MPGRIPADPAIYHITSIDNLPDIVKAGRLWCDAQVRKLSLAKQTIGYAHIKARRLRRTVGVSAAGCLGDYVPFNFCQRSVMLYVVAQGHDEYRGGQNPIIHLISTVKTAIATGRPWAFTDRHADLGHAVYYEGLDHLDEVDWSVMDQRQWGGDSDMKERRQAEFLVHEWLPWSAILGIAVRTQETAARVRAILASDGGSPAVKVEPSWYYEGVP
jgi:hypothetical protein